MSDGAALLPTVLIVQRRLTHYRVPFFEALRDALRERGFRLRLLVGEPTPGESLKRDEGRLDWAERTACRYLLGGRLCWQNVGDSLAGASYVILTQENKLLVNWWLLGRRRAMPPRVALWGHGRNFQPGGRGAQLLQQAKSWLSRRADWWFAYTASSANVVAGFGYPTARITTLNNAVDASALALQVARSRDTDQAALRRSLGIGAGPVGLFVGSLYAEKRLDLLVDAALRVRRSVPDFRLAIAGSGPLGGWLHARVAGLDWVHLLGPVRDKRKAAALAVAEVMLNPGALGLSIVDSFAAGVPMVVAATDNHGPEVAYLEHGVNGLMTRAHPDDYAVAVVAALRDTALAGRLRTGCASAARTYTQEAMVARFADGVAAWATAAPHRITAPRKDREAVA
jgi:glycosyltransferase involved in cell wall biosynthesis